MCAVIESPLRSELFSSDQMEQYGKTLANLHTLSPGRAPDQLLARLADNESVLNTTRDLLMDAITTDRRITPAGDWLLDNFYLIEEQIRIARRHLPKGYSRALPRLQDGLSAGLPRVYDIAIETISHSDGRIDSQTLNRFITAYQSVKVLKLGELWAVPIMLRLALIENLRRIGARIAVDRLDRNQADYWADQITAIIAKDPKSLILVLADMARSDPPLKSAFVAEFARRLQGQGPSIAMPLTWIEQRLSECSLTIDHLIQSENQQQAADQVSMSNSISSLRTLGGMDWQEFVETMSVVEQTLRQDPGGVYSKMDFSTRDRYRHVVENVAKNCDLSEHAVAAAAIRLARESRAKKDSTNTATRTSHVGYFLVDQGLSQLTEIAGERPTFFQKLCNMCSRHVFFFYLSAIVLLTLIFSRWLLTQGLTDNLSFFFFLLLSCIFALSASHLAIGLVNWIATLLAKPLLLPRMDFSKAIPSEARTLVVVPTMLNSIQGIERLVEALEVRFLANRDVHLHFGLLTDFPDAKSETLPEDEFLIATAQQRIEALNEKYPHAKADTFFLLHRPRKWNERERVWMGYERKRGKLAALNSLLRNKTGSESAFSHIVGNTEILLNVKYVITLDTDTQLPRDAAKQLVGAMAHPLNRALYDEDKQRVTDGYGILQPRVAVSLPGSNRSRYALMQGSDAGIDPYTRAISDVYQDLFAEGSFIGKGIYDVDAFEQALGNRFPENRILSHDLIEGCYARAGLLSDVMLYEEYPHCYDLDVSRRHRWIRGDWQLLRWLMPNVPGPGAERKKNPLSLLSQWKLFDNLRRSLVPAALMLLALLGWTILPLPWFWTLAILGIILIPSLLSSVLELFTKSDEVLIMQHLAAVGSSTVERIVQGVFTLACLPYEAYFSLDAVLRTLWRMLIEKKRLLEWSPSGDQGSRKSHSGILGFIYTWCAMWFSPILALTVFGLLWFFKPTALAAAAPFLALWFSSPFLAWYLSLELKQKEAGLSPDQTIFLQKLSRKTWAFFETFVGPEDNWLPPDNYQEHPVPAIAHRTSPTNIGLSLLANLSAYDFGYSSAQQLITRTTNAFATLDTLERYQGHFYNWYDTRTLKPLLPRYVSTVDSGNLAGHLLTLRQGLLALPDQLIPHPRLFEGLRDTLRVLLDVIAEARLDGEIFATLRSLQKELATICEFRPTTVTAAEQSLALFITQAEELLAKITREAAGSELHAIKQALWWAHALVAQCQAALDEQRLLSPHRSGDREQRVTLRKLARTGNDFAAELITALEKLAVRANEFSYMEYGFLYDKASHLLAIGYNVDFRRRDQSYYDLLASEARLCNFVTISQGQLPQESWFALGRLLTSVGGKPILVSWSGSMFEYLMPLLVMPTYERTLLDETCKAAVARQIAYGNACGVPWGISESGYNTLDAQLNYQYRAFGVPGLGLKRGLADDLVIAPYASTLALMVAPEEACVNMQRLAQEGAEGDFGLYESIDYTPARMLRKEPSAMIRSFMAHHLGMSLLSLASHLLHRPMQKRFEADPLLQASMLLLQERVPKAMGLSPQTADFFESPTSSREAETSTRYFNTPDTPSPQVQLLSNGRYHVMVTNAGGGYSKWKDLAVTRWQEDSTRDDSGVFCYIRDVASGEFWSTAHQPSLKHSRQYEAIFSEGRAEFRRQDHDIETYTELAVSPEDDIELRRVTITNRSRARRVLEVTSYAEVVLAPPAADALHPAFSNLFVQTEILHPRQAILCTRRPRSKDEHSPWMFHLMAVHGTDSESVSYETNRMQFIGRGNTLASPQALHALAALSNSEGSVLDPIVSIRRRIILEPEQSASINIVSGIHETREGCMGLVEKYQDQAIAERVFHLAWTHGQVLLRQLNVTEADAQLYGRLSSSILYANASLRVDPSIIAKNHRGQSGLWGYSISGDLPIVLLRINDQANLNLVRQLVQAHAYWRRKGLFVDLIIWNENHVGYRQVLQDQIMGLIAAGLEANVSDRPGGIFVRSVDQLAEEDRILIQTVARAILSDNRGSLAEQITGRTLLDVSVPLLSLTRPLLPEPDTIAPQPRNDLTFFNGLAGFTPDGREYVITTVRNQTTPAPWVNVLANPFFGTVVSESGLAYTWSENAHEFRITPWGNDPVSDARGEAFYLRDEERGHFWSPTPLPRCGLTPYTTRHGFGYTVFEHTDRGIRSELWVYVALDAAIKFSVLKVRNESGRPRRLSATGYMEWVLGDLRSKTAMQVITEIDPKTGSLFSRNPYNTEFAGRTAFFDVDETSRTITGDRAEFLGRNGRLSEPAAMLRTRLSGKVGAGLDPCGAIQVSFDLAPGQEREIIFRLGVGKDTDDARNLVNRFRGTNAARLALDMVWQHWTHTLGAIHVETPDQSLNLLANGWLLYQTLSCRLWARSGYYQSGGAFGFRDQLQDVMALIHSRPGLVREHLLLCAAHQFSKGDVQHWWHPPTDRGVRTRCSDDFLWLPLAVSRYVRKTGDTGILDEPIHFIQGRAVSADEDSYFDLPSRSEEAASLYEHCVRAILHGLAFGEHGLPLIGTGDWNDGMNLVGEKGKGESIWLGFFLYDVLMRFTEIARLRDDQTFAARCQEEATRLRKNIAAHGWDGEWYRRAYFDDGSLLGSKENTECQIDSIAQSWSVLSGGGDDDRSRMAMEALDKRLVRRDQKLVQLLDPPFDKSALNPGYIKGYVPGVRENGGQYTHAAIWATMAFARLGDNQRAWELFCMINPVNHGRTKEEIATYKVEPYVVAADVYAVSPHIGQGGWTWYTGSAAWMYRLIIESLLGIRLEVDKLYFTPCIPADWESFKVHYRFRETVYHITVMKRLEGSATQVTIDGNEQADTAIHLVDDQKEHTVEVRVLS